MFTGLIEETGRVERIEEGPGRRRIWIAAGRVLEGTAAGDSVAVNGCCLTATAVEPGRFACDAVEETLERTTIGEWAAGRRVNLERAMRLDQRLGGHLVQGHVDGVGAVTALARLGAGARMTLELPLPLARFVAEKGSIAVDGVSLTVAAAGPAECEIALIPHTLAVVADGWAEGARVHLEVDVIARYVARLMDTAKGRSA